MQGSVFPRYPDSQLAVAGGISRNRVYVQNLPKDIRQEVLERFFGEFGHVLGSQIITAGAVRSGRVCAIIRYQGPSAEAAIAAIDDKREIRVGDGPLRVSPAKANPKWE